MSNPPATQSDLLALRGQDDDTMIRRVFDIRPRDWFPMWELRYRTNLSEARVRASLRRIGATMRPGDGWRLAAKDAPAVERA